MDTSPPTFDNPPGQIPADTPSLFPSIIPAPLDLDDFIKSGVPDTSSAGWQKLISSLGLSFPAGTGGLTVSCPTTLFGGASFSSSKNVDKFGSSAFDATRDDPDHSVVLGMLDPVTGPLAAPILFADIRHMFGIDDSEAPQTLVALLNAVDQTGLLTLSLDTTPAARNAMWAIPNDAYTIVVNMVFTLTNHDAFRALERYIKDQYGVSIEIADTQCSFEFNLSKAFIPNPRDDTDWAESSVWRMAISMQVASFYATVVITPFDFDFFFSDPPNTVVPGSIIERLSDAVLRRSDPSVSNGVDSGSLPSPGGSGPFNSLLREIHLWYVSLRRNVIGHDVSGSISSPVYGPLYWQISLLCAWNVGASHETVLLSLMYDSSTSTFTGRLLFAHDLPDDMAKRQPDYFWVTDGLPLSVLQSLDNRPIPASLDIWGLFSDSGSPPRGIPSQLTQGYISFTKEDANGSSLAFATTINSTGTVPGAAPATAPEPAPGPISWDEIGVQVYHEDHGGASSTNIQVSTSISLGISSTFPPASLAIDAEFLTGGFWTLHGHVEDLSIGLFASFFHPNISASATGLLGTLALRSLDILYTFHSSGEASSFLITGALTLGDLELDLTYQFASGLIGPTDKTAAQIAWAETPGNAQEVVTPVGGTSQWSFQATLGAQSPGSTVGSVVASLSPDTYKALPAFVRDIEVPAASGKAAPVLLRLDGVGRTGTGSGTDASGLILTLRVSFAGLTLTFLSISETGATTKRLLRVSASQIPLLSNVPLIDKLPQPFDELLYVWLDDASGKGFTGNELKVVNVELAKSSTPKVLVKEGNQPSATQSSPVLLAGHHFMVVQGGKVILDHCFSEADPPDPASPAPPAGTQAAAPTKGSIDKDLPFLTIHAITLQFHAPILTFSIDATIVLGPIEFTVIGFDINCDLSHIKLNNLAALLTGGLISVGLHGIAVNVDKPPIKLAGVFIYEKTATVESYSGGIAFGFQAWQFMAIGEYQVITGPPDYKSLFVFAKLDGPLITLAFATVSGVRLGFGYNSIVRSPTLLDLPQFPFLNDPGSSNDPTKILLNMRDKGWVSAKQDSYWVCAGLTMTAFGILAVTAVAMVGFHDAGVVIGVYADGVAQMPPGVDADACLFYVEIGMLAELNTVDGYFTVQAALAPTSHVLVPSCRLTGGFALVNWFAPSTHAGDFVFTVGGYHRAFKPPPWYPVVPRIGVSFTLGDVINVTGVVYFAITPKCVMGGGAIHFGLEVGPVSAWLDIVFDVFVQFEPFHYMADLSVSVGCAITIKVWFVHVRICVSVGAGLHIEGPDPFGGFANIDFYLFSFTIHFGGKPPLPPARTLVQFYEMVRTPGPESPPDPNSSVTDQRRAQLKFTCSSGLLPPPTAPTGSSFPPSGATAIWLVKSGTFSCNIGFDFGITTANLITDMSDPNHPVSVALVPTDGSDSTTPPLFSKPMQMSEGTYIYSTVTIKVYALASDPAKNEVINGFDGELVRKDSPQAIWGAYDAATDPARNPASATTALSDPSGPTISLCMAVNIRVKPPKLTRSPVQDFEPAVAFRFKLAPSRMAALEPRQNTLLPGTTVYPNEEPTARWNHVAADWQDAAEAGQALLEGAATGDGKPREGILTATAEVLGWAKPSSPAGSNASWTLNSKLPRRLVSEMATRYPVLPRYTGGT